MFGIGSGKPPKKLFEFGSVEERDRMQIREVIAPGKLLDESCLPADVLVSGHSALPAVEVARRPSTSCAPCSSSPVQSLYLRGVQLLES